MTTFGIEARCQRLVTYTHPRTDLPQLREEGTFAGRWMHIGGGSNLLFTGDFDGAILRCAGTAATFHHDSDDDTTVRAVCPAGAVLDDVCHAAASRGYGGIENLSGIPGTMGGAAVQNVGAYGVELKDVVESVTVYDVTVGTFLTLNAADCRYGYRTSMFKHTSNTGRYIVAEVTLRLSTCATPRLDYGHLRQALDGKEPSPMAIREAVTAMRDSKLPNPQKVGSAGSFFKNPEVEADVYEAVAAKARSLWGDDTTVPHFPLADGRVKIPAAWFIDRLGWKGHQVGGAAVWEKQPLVLVNLDGNATASQVISLQQQIIDDIYNNFGIKLHPEVIFVGD